MHRTRLFWKVRFAIFLLLAAATVYWQATGRPPTELVFGSVNPPVVWSPLDPAAFADQGERFLAGVSAYNQEDFATAIAIWTPVAEAGHAQAAYQIGAIHYFGWGVPVDRREAATWFAVAAEKDHPSGLNALGHEYRPGGVFATDERKASALFHRAMERGSPVGTFSYAQSLYFGQGVPKDQRAAYELFRKAESMGVCRAHQNLGDIYTDGIDGVPADAIEAYRQFRLARLNGCPTRLGEFTMRFHISERDRRKVDRELGVFVGD